jgi:hypothetical protein
MKSFNKTMVNLFKVRDCDFYEAIRLVELTLEFLFEDQELEMDDTVAGSWTYEELIGTLLTAKANLELGRDLSNREEEAEA